MSKTKDICHIKNYLKLITIHIPLDKPGTGLELPLHDIIVHLYRVENYQTWNLLFLCSRALMAIMFSPKYASIKPLSGTQVC
jgi:hypothetical protein